MILDFNPNNGAFILKVDRWEADPTTIQKEHGLDFSTSASTPDTAVMMTREPYAAVAFYQHATERAKAQLIDLNAAVELSWAGSSGAHIKAPAGEELWPFQKAGVEYTLRRQNSLIGDVPGLGKTAQAICHANETGAKRVLVICPASIRLQWVNAIRRWSTMPWPYIVHPILNGRRGVHPDAAWTVVSYDLARTPTIGGQLSLGYYDLLIIDEGHYLKTIDAGRTRAIFGGGEEGGSKVPFTPLGKRADAILALTGTPLPNRPREAYTLTRGLCFDAIDFMSEDHFGDRFNPLERTQKEIPDRDRPGKTKIIFVTKEDQGRHGELQARLRSNFMIRRPKHGPRGVMNQLQLPIFDLVTADVTGPIKQALYVESLLDIDPEDLSGKDAETLGSIATVRRQMGEALAPQALAYVETLMEGGVEKLLLYAYHKSVIRYLAQKLQRFGVIVIDGSVGPQAKQDRIDEFVRDPNKGILLGQLLAVGTGTDGLQAVCDRAFFAESDWVHGNNQQGIDRLDRGGQKGQVLAEFLVAPGSFSEKILAGALRKGQNVHKALDREM